VDGRLTLGLLDGGTAAAGVLRRLGHVPQEMRHRLAHLEEGAVRVLVTGGLGYLGRAVTRQLLDAGHRVTVLTRAADRARPVPGADLAVADLRDRRRIREIVRGHDGICHLAALTAVRESHADPLTYFDVNVGGTWNLLDGVRAADPPTRIVYASTNIVYGSRRAGAFTEDADAHPESPYAASKLSAEHLVAGFAASGAAGAVSLRIFNIAGAVDGIPDTDPTRIIPNVFRTLTGELPYVTLNGDGSAVRDFVHLRDVAAAVLRSLDSAVPGRHRVYNIGSGTGTSMAEVIATAELVTGRQVPVRRMPPKPEAQVLVADNRRAVAELGWHPAHSDLRQIIEDGWAAWSAAAAPAAAAPAAAPAAVAQGKAAAAAAPAVAAPAAAAPVASPEGQP
jgi:UDP-glucose 4-epimerase